MNVCGEWAPLQVCGVQGPRPLAAASVDICVDTRTWKCTGCRRTRLLAAASVGICVDTHTWKCAGCRRPRLLARRSVGVRIIVEARVSLPIENARWVAVAAPPTPAAAAAAAAAGSSPMTRMPPRLHGRRGGGGGGVEWEGRGPKRACEGEGDTLAMCNKAESPHIAAPLPPLPHSRHRRDLAGRRCKAAPPMIGRRQGRKDAATAGGGRLLQPTPALEVPLGGARKVILDAL